jgi:hypothetical protein
VTAERPRIGWREWVALPDLGVAAVKAKVDTGARSSTLHATELSTYERDGESRIRFIVHPVQRQDHPRVEADAVLVGERDVRSSNGDVERRPVIVTTLVVLGSAYEAELTLTGRHGMGFRVLLGRTAVRRRFVVDPARSFFGGGATLSPP